jgi:hypothetical protein
MRNPIIVLAIVSSAAFACSSSPTPAKPVADAAGDDGSEPVDGGPTPVADATPGVDGSTEGGTVSPNLIANGDAEAAPGSNSGDTPAASIPSWTTTGNANIIVYGAAGGYPVSTDPGPSDRGMNLFSGGPDDAVSTFTQTIPLSAYASAIAGGHASFTLSAYLGGYTTQEDNAALTVYFLTSADAGMVPPDWADAGGLPSDVLSAASTGSVTATDRASATALLLRTITGTVPAGAVAAQVELVMTRLEGSANDGYADDLSLTLTTP